MILRVPEGRAVQDGAIVDASALALPWADPAAQWGVGVFETIAVRDAVPAFLEDHLIRLDAAAARFGVALPPPERADNAVRLVAGSISGGYGWLKIVVSRSGGWAVFGGASERADEGRAVAVVVLPWRRHRLDPVSGVKSLAYAASILGLEEAQRHGADEGLWLNERGHVVEACTANVFVVRGRSAVTPSTSDGARDGVTRARAVDALRAFGLSVHESKVRIATLRGADEIFLTSSLGGVRPVVRLDGREVRRGVAGGVTRRVAERLSAAAIVGAVAHNEDTEG